MRAFFGFVAAWGLTLSSFGATLVVDLDGGADYTDIQAAIDAAADGDTVLVKPGEYVITEPINFNRLHDPENPASPPVKNIVLKSEGGAEVTTIRMSEAPADPKRASVAIFENAESERSRLEGFKVTGGTGTLSGFGATGGGLLCCEVSSPSIVECTFSANTAASSGGGVSCRGHSAPTFTGCTISDNQSGTMGGGVCVGESASPQFSDCRISGNLLVDTCEDAAICGGGGFACVGQSCSITHCVITENTVQQDYGGGVLSDHSDTVIRDSTISVNVARGEGGGAYGWGTMLNCVISENFAAFGGGIGGQWALSNCTIAGNSQDGIRFTGIGFSVINCIVWGNHGASIIRVGDWPPAPFGWGEITYSCVESGGAESGDGNINEDPLFCGWAGASRAYVDAANSRPGDGSQANPFRELGSALDYRLALSAESPCIGAGKDGANMGADAGTCEEPGPTERSVLVARGHYRMEGQSLAFGASLLGAGAADTVLEGTVWGLRTGAALSGVTVTNGKWGGVVIPKEEGPTILECSITGNSAMWTGGGVQCLFNSFPEIKSSTISENSACWEGGGVFCEQSFPKLTNCIISGNRAQSGGGLGSSWGASRLTLTNCTISGNMGGGVYCPETGKPTVLTNCIVWGNAGKSIWPLPDNPGNSAVSFCVIEGEPLWPGENISNLDPRFVRPGAWDDNGTPDDPSDDKPIPGDYRLQPASSAIDAGMQEGASTTDIDGHGRPCGAWVDIGAYEFGDCASPTKFRRADVDGNGSLEITDPIKLLGYEFLGKPTPTCLDSADANDDGKLDISDAIYSLSFQFLGGIAPESPFPDCGIDPVIDELDCESYPGCQ